MSNFSMARLRPLNMPLLRAAETHGRRLDATAIKRKVRDEPSLTWVPDGVEGDALALPDRLADHVAGALVPAGKTKAQHMLVKLPASVPVETREQAQAALELIVQFAQDTFGGAAVFSARMDRDERSLNSVDVFLAPRYEKVTKRASKQAVSMTRFTKMLVEKHAVVIEQDSARGSMSAQGKALQTELAQWLTGKGYEAERGKPKTAPGDDWVSPEIAGMRIELEKEQATLAGKNIEFEQDRAAFDDLVAKVVPNTMQDRTEAKRLLAEAAQIKLDAQAATRKVRSDAAARIRQTRKVARDRIRARVEKSIADARTVQRDRNQLDIETGLVEAAKRKVVKEQATVSRQATLLAGLIEKLEPMFAVVARAHERLQHAPDQVRRWLDSNDRVGESVKTVGPTVAQATEILRSLVKRPQVTQPVPADEIDMATLAAARDGKNGLDA